MEDKEAEKSQVQKYVPQKQQTMLDPLLLINANLQQKYLLDFNFFLSKPINEIVYELFKRPATQAFIDSKIASQQNQYLKRHYHSKTQHGHEEIKDRIKMLGEFYNMSQKRWKFQYPMMIVTNTKSIFQKRQRRYKKICAGQGSSDQTQQKSQFYCYSFDTQNFLKDLSNVSQIYNHEKNDLNEQSFDSDVHDIYFQQSNIYKKLNFLTQCLESTQSSQNIFKMQDDLDHLICDFDDRIPNILTQKINLGMDQGKSDQLCEKGKSDQWCEKTGKKSMKSYDLKNFSQLVGNNETIKESNKTNRTNYLSSYLSLFQNKYRKLYLDPSHSILGKTDIKTTTDGDEDTENDCLKQIDTMIEKQKEEKLKNRKRIRQKAQELLRKVRVSSQS